MIMDKLRDLAIELSLKLRTTFDAAAWPGQQAYLVEICGEPGDVYAQGFGVTLDAAAAACWADWEKSEQFLPGASARIEQNY